jgi:hypothetical protein
MREKELHRWIEAYGRAWETNDPGDIATECQVLGSGVRSDPGAQGAAGPREGLSPPDYEVVQHGSPPFSPDDADSRHVERRSLCRPEIFRTTRTSTT